MSDAKLRHTGWDDAMIHARVVPARSGSARPSFSAPKLHHLVRFLRATSMGREELVSRAVDADMQQVILISG